VGIALRKPRWWSLRLPSIEAGGHRICLIDEGRDLVKEQENPEAGAVGPTTSLWSQTLLRHQLRWKRE
jgi:hypothetical protein